ncbi:MAG: tail fiber domain-containing protein, partial [Candidatus Poseidoniales archaeon]
TDTSGNYVATITCSNGISSTGATSGEGIAHTISIDTDLRGDVFQIGRDTNDYYVVNTTTHDWYLDGVLDLRLQNDGNLHVEGNVVAHSAVTSSDIKLKENIKIIEDPVAKVQQIKGVEFTWKKDGNESAGVIAQDVEQILPQAV